ncbi:uncharacterized protein LOC115623151 [Scaptodrosophila lebanonensis]|uniref:Uncharacterized protein LOC115623151 n=1 Tax=Drosophila lebanonensis TaxID=7225 RepID=A0A6J2T8J1_DROLE|nr:uncharacterized protein LOC115623151 [Scaptodrosophila lebanonensis]
MPDLHGSDEVWKLRFVDIIKPYPNHTLANVTFKILRFFYPPSALQMVDIRHVVQNPKLSHWNATMFVGFTILMGVMSYLIYKHYFEIKPIVREEPERLNELETRMKQKYGSEYKLGIWQRKDLPVPSPGSSTHLQNNMVEENEMNWISESSNTGSCDGLLPENADNPAKSVGLNAENNTVLEQLHVEEQREIDIPEDLGANAPRESSSRGSVKFNKQVKCRIFDGKTQLDLDIEEKDDADMSSQIQQTVKENLAPRNPKVPKQTRWR